MTTFSAQLNRIMTGETINKAPIKSDTSSLSDTNTYVFVYYMILPSHRRFVGCMMFQNRVKYKAKRKDREKENGREHANHFRYPYGTNKRSVYTVV